MGDQEVAKSSALNPDAPAFSPMLPAAALLVAPPAQVQPATTAGAGRQPKKGASATRERKKRTTATSTSVPVHNSARPLHETPSHAQQRGGRNGAPRNRRGGGGGGQRSTPSSPAVVVDDPRDLLNFRYDPPSSSRSTASGSLSASSMSMSSASASSRRRTQQPQRKREQFFHANCQLVVAAGSDPSHYSGLLVTADWDIAWERVELAIVYSMDDISRCPICLGAPVAAKVARCGHVYCWPCLLRFFTLASKSSAYGECPVCGVYIERRELVSAVLKVHERLHVGDMVQLTRMRRPRQAAVALPAPLWHSAATETPPQFDADHLDSSNLVFSRILVAPARQVLEQVILRERRELCEALDESRGTNVGGGADDTDVPFLECALVELDVREKEVQERIAVEAAEAAIKKKSLSEEEEAKGELDKGKKANDAETTMATTTDDVFFYQASDGRRVFLQPLIEQCLAEERKCRMRKEQERKEMGEEGKEKVEEEDGGDAKGTHGKNSTAMDQVSGKIVEIEEVRQDTDVRKRYKRTAHLPVGALFQLVEIELVVSAEVRQTFAEELRRRKKRRHAKGAEERRREERLRMAERLREEGPPMRAQIESRGDFPMLYGAEGGSNDAGEEEDVPFEWLRESARVVFESQESANETDDSTAGGAMASSGGALTSFSNVLLGGGGGNASRGVAYVRRKGRNALSGCSEGTDGSGAEDAAQFAAPSFQSEFGVHLWSTGQSRREEEDAARDEGEGGEEGRRKKKNKKKGSTLFSTSSARAYL